MEVLVVVEKGKTSYGAYVPDLPGCEAGEPIPVPSSKSEIVKIRVA